MQESSDLEQCLYTHVRWLNEEFCVVVVQQKACILWSVILLLEQFVRDYNDLNIAYRIMLNDLMFVFICLMISTN